MFDDIEKSLCDLPATWYPSLLKTLLEESHKKDTKIWPNSSAVGFVKSVEKEIKNENVPNCPECSGVDVKFEHFNNGFTCGDCGFDWTVIASV